jgi:Flp pilus assembly protein TadG
MKRLVYGSQRRAGVVVEFAITVPLVFLTAFGAWDFSRANNILHTIDNAAYEGCRRGIVPGATADDVRDAATSVLDAVLVQGATLTVTPAVIDESVREVTLRIDVPMNNNAWVAPLFLQDRTFTATYTLAREDYVTGVVP